MGGSEGGREREREGGWEGVREGERGWEGERDGGRVGGREYEIQRSDLCEDKTHYLSLSTHQLRFVLFSFLLPPLVFLHLLITPKHNESVQTVLIIITLKDTSSLVPLKLAVLIQLQDPRMVPNLHRQENLSTLEGMATVETCFPLPRI